jgi:hypothetical protein
MKIPRPSHLTAAAAMFTAFLTAPLPALAQDQSPNSQSQSSDNHRHPSKKQNPPADMWDNTIGQLSSPSRKVRVKAFDAITRMLPSPQDRTGPSQNGTFADSVAQLDPAVAGRLKSALIEALALEQKLHAGTQSNAADVDDDYYRPVVLDIASLNDQRALPLLVKELSTGDVVGRAVTRFGLMAVRPVIEEGDDMLDSELNRSSCPGELVNLLQAKTVTPDGNPVEYGLIKSAAVHWATAPEFEMRDADVLLLEQINDPDTIATLKNVAAGDPESTKGPDGAVHFYVRESAKAALDRLGGMAGKGYFDRPM